jgi:polysaccharide deacetylase 2 family uncharacterized protein YibQ
VSDEAAVSEGRTPTFLARYPRNLKLFVVVVFVFLAASPRIFHLELVPPPAVVPSPVLPDMPPDAATAVPVQEQGELPALPNDPRSVAAMEENDRDDKGARMMPAPDERLIEITRDGNLPRIGPNARAPWQVYARPFNMADPRPRVAVVISNLGLSNVATTNVLDRMPSQVTLAINAQSPTAGSWLSRARQVGHETLLAVPMEPVDYPRSDPGPKTLLDRMPSDANIERLYSSLKRGTGYVGITSFSGSRLMADDEKISVVLDVLRERGLLFFDSGAAPRNAIGDMAKTRRVPFAVSVRHIDDRATAEDIDEALNQLERTARLAGKAVVVASPTPLTLDRLDRWFRALPSHHLVLAPLTAVIE